MNTPREIADDFVNKLKVQANTQGMLDLNVWGNTLPVLIATLIAEARALGLGASPSRAWAIQATKVEWSERVQALRAELCVIEEFASLDPAELDKLWIATSPTEQPSPTKKEIDP